MLLFCFELAKLRKRDQRLLLTGQIKKGEQATLLWPTLKAGKRVLKLAELNNGKGECS